MSNNREGALRPLVDACSIIRQGETYQTVNDDHKLVEVKLVALRGERVVFSEDLDSNRLGGEVVHLRRVA